MIECTYNYDLVAVDPIPLLAGAGAGSAGRIGHRGHPTADSQADPKGSPTTDPDLHEGGPQELGAKSRHVDAHPLAGSVAKTVDAEAGPQPPEVGQEVDLRSEPIDRPDTAGPSARRGPDGSNQHHGCNPDWHEHRDPGGSCVAYSPQHLPFPPRTTSPGFRRL